MLSSTSAVPTQQKHISSILVNFLLLNTNKASHSDFAQAEGSYTQNVQ